MLWEDFLYKMHVRTGCPKELVRIILEGVPEVLMDMEVGERVWTPLGNFRMKHRKARMVNYFGNTKYYPAPERFFIKLDPGKRLIREPDPQQDDNTIEFNESPNPDPEPDE